MNDIMINNEYGYDKDYSFLDKVFEHTLKDQKIENAVFSVIFVDEKTIKKINKEIAEAEASLLEMLDELEGDEDGMALIEATKEVFRR